MEWKMDRDIKIVWGAIAIVLALFVVCLCSCKTQESSTVDFTVDSSEDYQERSFDAQSDQRDILVALQRDTLKETVRQSGKIDIERDTAGRTIRIIYDHIFNGLQTSGSSRVDTVLQKQVIILRDSVGNGQTDTAIKGKSEEKTTVGFGLEGLLTWAAILCILCIGVFILVKWLRSLWKE